MESIYLENLNEGSSEERILSKDELNHLKVLRIRDNETIFATNGRGISAEGFIYKNGNDLFFKVKLLKPINFNENKSNVSMLIGALDNRDRMEFALEKCVEMGIQNVYLVKTKFSSPKKYILDRLNNKLLSAFKQCKRTILPKLFLLDNIFEITKGIHKFKNVYIADIDGVSLNLFNFNQDSLIAVGPEGGFEQSEIDFLIDEMKGICFKMGETRLRAETAVIAALAIFNFKIGNL